MKMPKIHGLEDHFIASMEQWNEMGNFLEDFIEQAHQFGWRRKRKQQTWETGWERIIHILSGNGLTRWVAMYPLQNSKKWKRGPAESKSRKYIAIERKERIGKALEVFGDAPSMIERSCFGWNLI
jgi:hypothetical protein